MIKLTSDCLINCRKLSRLSLSEKLDWMYNLNRFGIKLGLKNMKRLCSILGNPQKSFKAIHIAGTNGKGSTSSMISSILNQANIRVGLYTSPHLAKFNERISINGMNISDQQIGYYIDLISKKMNLYNKNNEFEKIEPTFFEFTTMIAFLYFSKMKVDYAVIETGMGGRLDATNVIIPELSIITTISDDHSHYLGNSPEKILIEKLGIVKKNVKLITGVKNKSLLKITKDYTSKLSSDLEIIEESFSYTNYLPEAFDVKKLSLICDESKKMGCKLYESFSYNGDKVINDIKCPLLGKHQINNSVLAIRAVEILFPKISEFDIKQGIKNTVWKGRFDLISCNPGIIIDAAHNVEGMTATMDLLDRFNYNKIIAMVGFSNTKNSRDMLKILRTKTKNIIISKSDYLPKEILRIELEAKELGFNIISSFDDPMKAYNYAKLLLNKEDDCLIVVGSIYMIGKLY
jgi:dihydrofolate synthase/folylpolyglutamate synthase